MRASARSIRRRPSPFPAWWRSSPIATRRRPLFSTARHENRLDDPDDTLILDPVLRFIGQRVAAVVATTEAAAEEACRRIRVDYDVLPAVFDPADAMAPGAPVLHDKGRDSRIYAPERNLAAALHGGSGDVAAGLAEADAVHRGELCQPARPACRAGNPWRDRMAGRSGRLVIRSSTQVPFLTRDALCRLFGLAQRPGPGAGAAGWRRLRRQAGDADRGHRGARRAAHRPPGEARADTAGAVRDHDDTASDADPGRRWARSGTGC